MALLRGRPFRKLLLVLVSALVAGEIAARVADSVRGIDSSVVPLPDPESAAIVPHPYIGWIHKPNHVTGPPNKEGNYTTNSLGLRGPEIPLPKPPGTYRIACVGGSTTAGDWNMRNDETWPGRLQAILQERLPPDSPYTTIETINAGEGAYTSMECLINLKMRLLPLDLDLVVTYNAANDAKAIPVVGFKPDYTHVRRSWTEPPPRPLLDRLLGWSHFYGLFLDEQRRLGPRLVSDRVFVDGVYDLPALPLAELEPGFETFYWTQREIVALARTRGLPVMLCTFAWPRTGRFAPSEHSLQGGYIAVVRRLNEITREVAAIDGTALVDVERLGPGDSALYSDPVHPNTMGYQQVARVVAGAVLAQGLLLRPPPVNELPSIVLHPEAEPDSGD